MKRSIAVFIIVAACFLGAMLFLANAPQSTSKTPITIVTYNIRHGLGLDNRLELDRIARVLQNIQPDFVALQEVDMYTHRSHEVDETAYLGSQTGLHSVFVPAMPYDGGYYGNAILSRFPIIQIDTLPLPGEPRVAAFAIIALPQGTTIDTILFIATHLDTEEHPRNASIPILQHHVKRYPFPAILAGDFNTEIHKPEFQLLLKNWYLPSKETGLLTFPANAPDRQIDFILLKPRHAWKVISVSVYPDTMASDHLPVIMKVEKIK